MLLTNCNAFMDKPLISIITTGFNRDKYLEQCFNSVIAQSYSNWELIYWDDGSGDRSRKIAREFGERHRRIRPYGTIWNRGRAKALEDAHTKAAGDYIGWLDTDDRLHPDALGMTVEILDKYPDCGLVYTDYTDINDAGEELAIGHRCGYPYSKEALLNKFMVFHFRLYRRSLFDAVGGIDTRLKAAIDYDLVLRMSEVTRFIHIPVPLYYYRLHDDRMGITHYRQQYNDSLRAVEWAKERRKLV